MLPIPIPWWKLWRYKLLIPIMLAMAFLMWGAGADIGADAAMTGNETVVKMWTGETMDAAMNEALADVERDTVLSRTGAEILIGPFIGAMMNVLADGFWFGYHNPDLGEHAANAALLAAYGTIIGYLYFFYRVFRRLFRW